MSKEKRKWEDLSPDEQNVVFKRIEESKRALHEKRAKETAIREAEDKALEIFSDNAGSRRYGNVTVAVKREFEDTYNITAAVCSEKDAFSSRTGRVICARRFNTPRSITVTIPGQTIGTMLTIAESILMEDFDRNSDTWFPQGR